MNIDLAGTLARLGDDRELFLEFIQIFREDSPQRVQAIREGLERGDAHAVSQAAHSLRGLAASLGATHVVADLQVLETMARTGDLRDCRSAYQNLRISLDGLDEELSEIKNFGF